MIEGATDFVVLARTDDGSDLANLGATPREAESRRADGEAEAQRTHPFPYSTDMEVNPLIYSDISGLSIPHGVGTIWASALWELYWRLVAAHGFDPLDGGEGGNQIALHLVEKGLELQPCNATFLEARDAILQADETLFGGGNRCDIWRAFAKRGMGVGADDGDHPDSLGVVDSFALPVGTPGEATSGCLTEPLELVDDLVHTPKNERVSIGVLANDDGDELQVIGVTDPEHGQAEVVCVLDDCRWTDYNPDNLFVGTDSFDYLVEDAQGNTGAATVTVIVECARSGVDFLDGFDPEPQPGWLIDTAVNDDEFSEPWAVEETAFAESPPNAFRTESAITLKDDRLISPPIGIAAATALSFRHRTNMDEGLDGGVLEVSTDGGVVWRDIEAAGGTLRIDTYNSTISPATGNPLAGRDAWSGLETLGSMDLVLVNLEALAGETVLFRWRAGFDFAAGPGAGWWIDDVEFTDIDTGVGCNTFPTAVADAVTTTVDQPVAIDVLANDTDPEGDALLLLAAQSPTDQGGTVEIDTKGTSNRFDDSVIYTPPPGFAGTDTFTYRIGDGDGWDEDVVTVTVEQSAFLTPCTEPLFADGFESGDLAAWSDTMNPSLLTVDGALALEGAFGLGAEVSALQAAVIDQTPGSVDHYCWSFVFDPSAAVMPDGLVLKMGGARGTDLARMLDVALRFKDGVYGIGFKALQNNGKFAKLPFVDLVSGPNLIEAEWSRSPGGSNGVLRVYVNGLLAAETNNIANDQTPALAWWGMGMMGLHRNGMGGTLVFDSFESRTDP